ncbi:MAG TPA: hypothetical protein VK530_01515 [Candidatus Acidoferrum sp.]|nr:hypothetical protein [Candidatus Acidoferrum sp.]
MDKIRSVTIKTASKIIEAGEPKPATRQGTLKLRTAQAEYFRGVDLYRLSAFVARRQYGKTTTFAAIALKKMMKKPNHTVVFGSVKLNLAREIVRKEAEIIGKAIRSFQSEQDATERLQLADSAKGNLDLTKMSDDDLADIYEAQRMEFRYFHSRTTYSRTKVVALSASTVGETGDLMADEVGRAPQWLETWEAIEPIISSNPEFRLTLATTPPPDDAHFSYTMLAPPIGATFPVNKLGNWYKTELGVMVLRVSAYDAWADGIPVYDLSDGKPLSPEEHFRRAFNKDAWRRNYGADFVLGGTAALPAQLLDVAQARGIGKCKLFSIDADYDLDAAIEWLLTHIGSGPVGFGWDTATTEKDTSNPSAFTVLERRGNELVGVLTCIWKQGDPAVQMKWSARIVRAIAARAEGGRGRKLSIDGTNERLFARAVKAAFAADIPVEIVVNSETLELPGEDTPLTKKQVYGNRLINTFEENRMTVAPERYIKEDFRLVKKDRGMLVCDLGPDGQHGDTFDSHKLALHSLSSPGGSISSMEGIVMPGLDSDDRFAQSQSGLFIPTHLSPA